MSRRILLPLLSALSLACFASGSAAQSADESKVVAQSTDADEQELVVHGHKLEEIERFVEQLTAPSPGGQIARWNGEICPRALGLLPEQNAYLARRVGEIARLAHVPVAKGRCQANIIILVSDEADRLARLLLEKHPKLFSVDKGRAPPEMSKALLAPKPVRWLNASHWANGEGKPVVVDEMSGTISNPISTASRLYEPTREDAVLSVLIVDAKRVDHVSWGGLSAYLAMVALARPSPDGEPDSPSILSLFQRRDTGQPVPRDLTSWDRAFLKGLYGARSNVTASFERSDIRTRMKKALESPEGEAAGR